MTKTKTVTRKKGAKSESRKKTEAEFTMETGKSISAISRRVKDMSKDDWRPLGGAFFFYTDKGSPAFAQSLIRSEKKKSDLGYAIQTGKSPSALSSRVNIRINEGQSPIGSGFVFRSADGNLVYCQTMISEE